MRGLCIIRLISLLIFAGAANVCVAAESGGAGSLSPNGQAVSSAPGNTSGPIRDPLNPQAYMSQLASKLNSSDGKGLLMKGMEKRKTHAAASPAPKAASSKPVAGTGVVAAPTGTPVQAPPAGAGERALPKQEPVAQVATMTVWNGLSSDNRAAQRAMEEIGAARMANASQVAQLTVNDGGGAVPAAPRRRRRLPCRPQEK